ncbi:MAG: hypothetical protein GXN93_03145 [Candidatus Diapherotrites archaeon]|nr:hypothetical protein [Candidatus Diapherotrites archaeon]
MKGQQAIGTLVIFIALVITAAVATYVIMAATNQAGAKASGVSDQTVNNLTTGFTALSVLGYAPADDEIKDMVIKVKLAPGSSTVKVEDAKLQYSADAGTVYQVYTYGGVNQDANIQDFDQNTAIDPTKFYIFTQYTTSNEGNTPDVFLDQGEAYALAFKTPKPLGPGQDWSITITTAYTTPLRVAGVAPSVIKGGSVINLH